jgi:hypothetical protein
MIESKKQITPVLGGWWCGTITLVGCLLLGGVMAGQDLPNSVSNPVPQQPAAVGAGLKAQFTPPVPGPTVHLQRIGGSGFVATPAPHPEPAATPGTVLRITLDEAQQKAAGATNPLVRLGELQVEAARQHRLSVEALYFPNLGSQFLDFHANKQPGSVVGVQGPLGNASTGH